MLLERDEKLASMDDKLGSTALQLACNSGNRQTLSEKINDRPKNPPCSDSKFTTLFPPSVYLLCHSSISFHMNYYHKFKESFTRCMMTLFSNTIILYQAHARYILFFRTKPLQYLGWLLGHEGKGSVMAYLKKRFMIIL